MDSLTVSYDVTATVSEMDTRPIAAVVASQSLETSFGEATTQLRICHREGGASDHQGAAP